MLTLRQRLRLYFFLGLFCSLRAQAAELGEIEALLSNAEYRQAIEAISLQLKNNDLTYETRTRLFWLKAYCHVSEGQIAQAKASLINVLVTNPRFEPDPNASPKILKLFKTIYADFKEQGGLENTIRASFIPIESIVPGTPHVFQIRLEDESMIRKASRLQLHLRRLGNSEYSSVDFKKVDDSGLYEAKVPPVLTRHIEQEVIFEYFVSIASENGTRLGTIGRATLPLLFSTKLDSKPTNHDNASENRKTLLSTVLITCAATLAVGGTIAVILILTAPQEGRVGLKIALSE